MSAAACGRLSKIGVYCSAVLDPLRVVSADAAAERLVLSDELEDGLFEQWLSARSMHAEADAARTVLNLPINPNDISALDAMRITCTVEGPLTMLVPPVAITALAGVLRPLSTSVTIASF